MSCNCPSKPGRCATAALLLAAALLSSCGGGDTGEAAGTTAAPPTTTTAAPTTTAVPTAALSTAVPLTATTTTAAASTTAAVEQTPLLVADTDGIRVTDSDGVVATFLDGASATVAFPDLTGGVVFQIPEEGAWAWAWDAVAGHAVIAVESGSGPSPIYHITAPGEYPEVLVAAHDARLSAQQVVHIDGRPTLVYRAWAPVEGADCAADDPACVARATAESLHLLDLVTGENVALGYVGEFESSWISYVLGPHLMVVLSGSYGETADACGRLGERSELMAVAGSSTWLGAGGPLWRSCEFPSEDTECVDCVEQIRAGIAPDEATVAYGMSSLIDNATVFAVLDVSSGEELRRVVVGARWTTSGWIDWDGQSAVVGGWLESGPVVLLRDGTSQQMPEGSWVVLWKET